MVCSGDSRLSRSFRDDSHLTFSTRPRDAPRRGRPGAGRAECQPRYRLHPDDSHEIGPLGPQLGLSWHGAADPHQQKRNRDERGVRCSSRLDVNKTEPLVIGG